MKDDYAVLKLGAACPPGSVQFSRHFDNEDGTNANFSDGDISPNVSTANTTLYFCMFRAAQLGDPTIAAFPNLAPGFSYGVFGPPDFNRGALALGTIRTDDEDTDNKNTYSVPAAASVAAQRIIDPDSSATVLHVLRAK